MIRLVLWKRQLEGCCRASFLTTPNLADSHWLDTPDPGKALVTIPLTGGLSASEIWENQEFLRF